MAQLTHVLFDFFGTLVAYDSSLVPARLDRSYELLRAAGTQLHYEQAIAVWQGAYDEHERRAQRTLDEFSMDALCEAFLPRVVPGPLDYTLIAGFRDTFLDEWSQAVRYLPEVNPLLAALGERYALVLVTNTHHAALVHGHLGRMEAAQFFPIVVTSVEHGRRKPSPCIFQRALEHTGGTPESAVYVGDSFDADYQGALAAGIRPLLIDPQRRHPIADEQRVAHVSEVRRLLT